MSLAIVNCRTILGVNAPKVAVEVDINNGLPTFNIVGLPDTSVKEARDRVKSAIQNSQFQFPQTRVTVNLSPADVPKEGSRFDLAIAIGILSATGQIPQSRLDEFEFYGELGLSGEIKAIVGEIPTILAARDDNKQCFLPIANASQALLINKAKVIAASSLNEVVNHLTGQQSLPLVSGTICNSNNSHHQDLSDVIGQQHAKRALEICAAGQHNLLFVGEAGSGKSMLASRLTSILPPMTEQEAITTAAIHSISGKPFDPRLWRQRPFRNPHHTASGVALVGGGSNPRPGEISLAHNGVLFLDELPEFERRVLDVLREPLETGNITISRAARQAEFPANFQFISALNPSPSGHYLDKRCSNDQILRYLNKLSGPLLDRIDIQIEVNNQSFKSQQSLPKGESSTVIQKRVIAARERMLKRANKANALLTSKEIATYCQLPEQLNEYLMTTLDKLKLSHRAYHKILKVARTIADLSGDSQINQHHLAEAFSYRAMDKIFQHLTSSI